MARSRAVTCADASVTVLAYRDVPIGTVVEDSAKGGQFTKVVLRPHVTIARGADVAKARARHESAHEKTCEPDIAAGE